VNVHLTATEHDDSIVFLHNVHDGPASQSYGLQVAKLAGVPQEVIRHAKTQLAHLEGSGGEAPKAIHTAQGAGAKSPTASASAFQGDMFASIAPSEVETTLEALDIDGLTPREALNRLYELKAMLEK